MRHFIGGSRGNARGAGGMIPWKIFDLVLVSGLVVDLVDIQSGLDRGDYDRALVPLCPQVNTRGLAFDIQAVMDLPVEARDVPLDLGVTETQTIVAKPAKRDSTGGALRR